MHRRLYADFKTASLTKWLMTMIIGFATKPTSIWIYFMEKSLIDDLTFLLPFVLNGNAIRLSHSTIIPGTFYFVNLKKKWCFLCFKDFSANDSNAKFAVKFTSGCYITTLITEWQDAWNGSETFLLKQVMISYLSNMTVSLMFVESKSWLSLTVSKISKLIERRYFWVSEAESCIRAICTCMIIHKW